MAEDTEQNENPAADAVFDALYGDGAAAKPEERSAGQPAAADAAAVVDNPSTETAPAEPSEAPMEEGTSLGVTTPDNLDQTTADKPETAPQPREEDPEQLRKILSTQEGRLAKAEADKKNLEEELTALRGAPGKTSPSDSRTDGDAEELQPATLPDSLVEDAREFETLYPHLAGILRQPGPEGERVRRVLGESGADIAALAAENVLLRQEIHAVDSGVKTRTRQEQQVQLVTRHPEVSGAFAAAGTSERQAADAFLTKVETWINGLPYGEAAPKMQIFKNGTFEQAAALFDTYKTQAKQQAPKETLDATTRRRATDAEGVDNNRGRKPPLDASDKSNADAMFDEVYGAK